MHHLSCILLSLPRLPYGIKQINDMVTRFITMCILPDHSSTENRQIFIRRRIVSEHTIQFLGKTFLASNQTDQSINVLLHRPEILPAITFANMRSIIIRTEVLNEGSFVIPRLHEGCLRIIHILIIPGTLIKFICNLLFTQFLRHTGNAIIIVSVFQGFRK